MSQRGWIPVDRNVIYKLKGWEVAAYLQLREDLEKNKFNPEKNKLISLRGYQKIWKKSKSAIEDFYKKIGYKSGQTLADLEAKKPQKSTGQQTGQQTGQVCSIITTVSSGQPDSKPDSKPDTTNTITTVRTVIKDKKTQSKRASARRAPVSSVLSNDPMMVWAAENSPKLFAMKKPLTEAQAKKLTADFSARRDDLKDVMLAMENNPQLCTKYESANLTIRNWMRIRANGKYSAKPTDDLNMNHPTMKLLT